jgi:protoheme IX farnesyltransferase
VRQEAVAIPRSTRVSIRDFAMLTKPRLSTLVLVTAGGAMWLAKGPLTIRSWLVLLAVHGVVAAAQTFNCLLERDSDKLMSRTRNRPLPAGRMEPMVAVVFGSVLAAISIPALALLSNGLTALLGCAALLLYVWVYTPLKAKTHWAMVVGAVPGAIPPLMGWTAVTGEVSKPAVALFLILFFWQLPHFIAIALFRMPEYRKAGLTSVPLELGEGAARAFATVYAAALFVVALLPFFYGVAKVGYLWAALVLGAAFFGMTAWGWWADAGPKWARWLFFGSLVYLTGLFAALALCRA